MAVFQWKRGPEKRVCHDKKMGESYSGKNEKFKLK